MNLLHDKRRAGVLALLSALVGAAALFLGIGAAYAIPTSPCHDQDWPIPDFNVTTGTGPYNTYAGTDVYTNGPFGDNGAWVCFSPTGGEPAQSFVVVTARANDPTTAPAGATATVGYCNLPLPFFPPGGWACNHLLQQTGATVEPSTSTNAPLNNTATGTGGSVGAGQGTCVYANSATPVTCTGSATVGGVTANEADVSVPTTHPNAGGCVTVPGNSCYTTVPSGMGVSMLDGDPANDTVTVTAAGTTQSKDLGGCYGFNAPSTC